MGRACGRSGCSIPVRQRFPGVGKFITGRLIGLGVGFISIKGSWEGARGGITYATEAEVTLMSIEALEASMSSGIGYGSVFPWL